MSKLELYKTAYSPLFKCFVSIKKIRYDDNNIPIIHATIDNGQEMLFRETELKDFCL